MLEGLLPIQEDFGKGKSTSLIVSSVLFCIVLYFYIINLASFIEPTVYPLIDRVTYITTFVDKHFVSNFIDFLVITIGTLLWFQFCLVARYKYVTITTLGLCISLVLYSNVEFARNLLASICFPVILLIIAVNKLTNRNFVNFDWQLSINYVSLFGIAIAIISTAMILTYIVFPELPLPSLNYLYYFYLILSIFSPLCLILLSLSYPFVLIFRKFIAKFPKNSTHDQNYFISITKKFVDPKTKILHISCIILLSIIIAIIPHMNTINEESQIIGVDTKHYVEILEAIASSSTYNELLYKVFVLHTGGDRPFSLLFFLGISYLFYQGDFSSMLEDLPLVLGPMLVMCVYFLAWGITRNHFVAVFASLITIPYHILIGIYGGLYANWFSLISSYLAIFFLFRLMNEQKKIYFIAFSLFLIVLLFSHTQTWTILIYVIGLLLAIVFLKNRKANKILVFNIFVSLLPSIIIEITRMFLTDTSGVTQEISFALEREVGFHGLSTIWHNLLATSHFTLAGLIGNSIILILAIIWLFVTRLKEIYPVFFVIFFSLFIFPILFGDQQIQSRFLFEIPIEIPAAIALVFIKERIGKYLPATICFWLLVMSAYMAANFVLVYH